MVENGGILAHPSRKTAHLSAKVVKSGLSPSSQVQRVESAWGRQQPALRLFFLNCAASHHCTGRIVSIAATSPLKPATTEAQPRRIGWFLIAIIVVHVLALAALVPFSYTFAWWGIPLVLVGNFIFGSLGINLGYHRMLTHKAASFPKFLERLWVLFGICSLEGSPLWWVCTHRMHHQQPRTVTRLRRMERD